MNKCRCIFGFQGDHCEIGQPIKQYYNCKRPCRHGYCTANRTCRCQQGWFGKFCQRSKFYNYLFKLTLLIFSFFYLEILKPKHDNHRPEYPHSCEDDDDDMDDYDEVPKSHHRWH